MQEHLLRSAVKEAMLKRRKGPHNSAPMSHASSSSLAHSERGSATANQVSDPHLLGMRVENSDPRSECVKVDSIARKRESQLRRALGDLALIVIPRPVPTTTWWHQYIALQTDCHIEGAFDDEYIAMLHTVLLTTSLDSFADADPSSDLPVDVDPRSECARIDGECAMVEDESVRIEDEYSAASLTSTGDPLCALVRTLQRESSRPIVIVDGTDVSIVIALWEIYRRQNSAEHRGGLRDINITQSFFPKSGVSMLRYQSSLLEKHKILSSTMWENLLFCLPLLINAGVPPLLMLQYFYRYNPMDVLAQAVTATSTPILCLNKDGETVIDLLPLTLIMTRLASREQSCIRKIEENCNKRREEAPYRTFSNITQAGWDQFRLYYYHTSSALVPSARTVDVSTLVPSARGSAASAQSAPSERGPTDEAIEKRVIAYVSSLLQLSSIYRGLVGAHHIFSRIRMSDAPLVEDILAVLTRLSSKSRYVGLPSSYTTHVEESASKRRTLCRLWPLISDRFCE